MRFPATSQEEIALALVRLQRAVPVDYQPGARQVALADAPEPPVETDPEATLLAQDEDLALTRASDALRVLARLPESEQLYLRNLLSGADDLPAREMARLMQRPVEEVYRLRQRVVKSSRTAWRTTTRKTWLASV